MIEIYLQELCDHGDLHSSSYETKVFFFLEYRNTKLQHIYDNCNLFLMTNNMLNTLVI